MGPFPGKIVRVIQKFTLRYEIRTDALYVGKYIDVGPGNLPYRCALDIQFRFHHGKSLYVNQALIGLDRGSECFPNPVFPSDDGLELIDFEGSCLTYEGEINKLAVNVAFGR